MNSRLPDVLRPGPDSCRAKPANPVPPCARQLVSFDHRSAPNHMIRPRRITAQRDRKSSISPAAAFGGPCWCRRSRCFGPGCRGSPVRSEQRFAQQGLGLGLSGSDRGRRPAGKRGVHLLCGSRHDRCPLRLPRLSMIAMSPGVGVGMSASSKRLRKRAFVDRSAEQDGRVDRS